MAADVEPVDVEPVDETDEFGGESDAMARKRRMKSAGEALVRTWRDLLKEAEKSKAAKRFRKGAKLGMHFYMGPHTDVFGHGGGGMDSSSDVDGLGHGPDGNGDGPWRMNQAAQVTVNKSFELVKVFGPFLYQSNPKRRVMTRSPNNPVLVALSEVIEDYLNYTPGELGLKREMRKIIDEGIIKGRGVSWTAIDDDTGLVGTFFESVDNIRIDPDVKDEKDAFWVARKVDEPKWVLEERYPGPGAKEAQPNTLTSERDKATNETPEKPQSNNVVQYFEVYSKMGVGIRSKAGKDKAGTAFDGFDDENDYKLIVVTGEGSSVPISVGDWPAPLFLDNEWMHSFLDFNPVPQQPWPISILSAAEGEQRAIDWLASFILNKAHAHSREVIAVDSDAGADFVDKVSSGVDMVIAEIKVPTGKNMKDLVAAIDLPGGQVLGILITAYNLMMTQFEARTGLNELLLSMPTTSMRSATEAELKQQNARIRPDDMARQVADFMTVIARKEAMLMRFVLDPEDITKALGDDKVYAYAIDVILGGAPLTLKEMGQLGQIIGMPGIATYFRSPDEVAQAAGQVQTMLEQAGYVVQIGKVGAARVWQDTADMTAEQIAREFSYKIETGSMQKLTPQARVDKATMLLQTMGPTAIQVGDYDAYNQLWDEYYDAIEKPKDERTFLNPPPPPPEEKKGKKNASTS